MLIIMIFFAALTYWLAQRKHRDPIPWAIAGGLAAIFTILGLAFFSDLANVEDEEAGKKSLKREKIFLGIMILLGLTNIILMQIGPRFSE